MNPVHSERPRKDLRHTPTVSTERDRVSFQKENIRKAVTNQSETVSLVRRLEVS